MNLTRTRIHNRTRCDHHKRSDSTSTAVAWRRVPTWGQGSTWGRAVTRPSSWWHWPPACHCYLATCTARPHPPLTTRQSPSPRRLPSHYTRPSPSQSPTRNGRNLTCNQLCEYTPGWTIRIFRTLQAGHIEKYLLSMAIIRFEQNWSFGGNVKMSSLSYIQCFSVFM